MYELHCHKIVIDKQGWRLPKIHVMGLYIRGRLYIIIRSRNKSRIHTMGIVHTDYVFHRGSINPRIIVLEDGSKGASGDFDTTRQPHCCPRKATATHEVSSSSLEQRVRLPHYHNDILPFTTCHLTHPNKATPQPKTPRNKTTRLKVMDLETTR